ncbi:MAG: hypothetical protein GY765_06545 [bacterium]|nr:hypothetical protein [bacterium]
MNKLKLAVIIVGLMVIVACGLPDTIVKAMKSVPIQIQKNEKKIDSYISKFNQFKNSPQYSEFKVYAEREKWENYFTLAKNKLRSAEAIYKKEVLPLLEKNKKDDLSKVQKQLKRFPIFYKQAQIEAKKPLKRLDFLKQAKAEAPQWTQKAREQREDMNFFYSKLETEIKTATSEFAERKDNLAEILGKATDMLKKADESLLKVNEQFQADSPDLAVFADNVVKIKTLHTECGAYSVNTRKKLEQLYESYSNELVDMRVDYFVTVGRTSWDNASDAFTEKDYIYKPATVTPAVYEYFSKLKPNKVLAKDSSGMFSSGLSVKIDKAKWGHLNIVNREKWPSSRHDASEFWMQDLPAKYYHKYKKMFDGEFEMTDWIEVKEDFYYTHHKHLGMEILCKPYGTFEDEISGKAAPPGMAYVGHRRYGRWMSGPRGRRYWGWGPRWGMYKHRYYHDDWNRWHTGYRNKKHYYGASAKNPTYGTYSKDTRSRFAGSYFGRTGGFNSQASSIRSGAGRRGGGPGRGGK